MGVGSECSVGKLFSWEDADSCGWTDTTVGVSLMPLTCALHSGYDGKFYIMCM